MTERKPTRYAYRGYEIRPNEAASAIPASRGVDWEFLADDASGDETDRGGYAATPEACCKAIDEQLSERLHNAWEEWSRERDSSDALPRTLEPKP